MGRIVIEAAASLVFEKSVHDRNIFGWAIEYGSSEGPGGGAHQGRSEFLPL